jgi:hypothetical protein
MLVGCGSDVVDTTETPAVPDEIVIDNHVKFYIESITYEGDAVATHDYKDLTDNKLSILIEFETHEEIMERYYGPNYINQPPIYGLARTGGTYFSRIYISEWTGWKDTFRFYVFGHEVRHCMEAGIGQVVHLND